MVGFDSFAGLPVEPDASERVGAWVPGSYAADPRTDFRANNTANPCARHARHGVDWVGGFFNETLADPLAERWQALRPAAYAH